jgi:hypothetical protein
MEMSDTFDRCDTYDTYGAGLSSRPWLSSTSGVACAIAAVNRGPETRAAWARLPRRRRGNTTEAICLAGHELQAQQARQQVVAVAGGQRRPGAMEVLRADKAALQVGREARAVPQGRRLCPVSAAGGLFGF